MSERVTKIPTVPRARRASKKAVRSKATPSKAAPQRASELVVQFVHPEDPTVEQTARVRDLVKKYTSHARLVAELPGALKVVVVGSDAEQAFRQDVAALPDWNIASEGVAKMPNAPLPEDDDERSS